MKTNLSTLTIATLLLTNCSGPTVDFENEKLKVRQELFENMFEAFKTKNAEEAVMRVPENGNFLVEAGEIKKYEKEMLRKHYQEEIFPNADFKNIEIVEEPRIDFFDKGKSCYGTIKIKVTLTDKSDSTNADQGILIAILFVGQKQNGRWVSLADSQTFPAAQ